MVTMASGAPSNTNSSPSAGDVTTTTIVKKSSENRRSNKPIMEKRRRARINNCLNELKSLILDAMKKDPARHSKLEKADILEMTVKHLESLQRQQVAMTAVSDPQVVNKFRAGFSECAGEVGRFPGLEPAVRRRLLQHLSNCLTSTPTTAGNPLAVNSEISNSNRLPSNQPQNLQVHILPSDNILPAQNGIFLSTGANTGVQLVPTRLPNGDIALVLPSVPSNSTNVVQQHHRLSASPSPSSSSSSPPPLTMLTPSRTASTSSAASSNSPIGFERLCVNVTSTTNMGDELCHSPSSMHSISSSPQSSEIDYSLRPYSPPLQKPLSLVVRKNSNYGDISPWRPW